MISSIIRSEPIEGLSKREQKKLEKVIMRQQINKTKIETKTCKRKASKGPHLQEPKPRKLNAFQQNLNKNQGQEKSQMIASDDQGNGSTNVTLRVKKVMKTINPFNSQFPVQGGQQGLFEYMIGYVSIMKQVQMEKQDQNLDFLDQIDGNQLEIIPSKITNQLLQSSFKQFQVEKANIVGPFDQNHKKLLKKFQIK